MREHTPREQALFDIRVGVVRRWMQRMEDSPAVQRIWSRVSTDTRAKTTLTRQTLFYGAVLVEPSGEVPHHILDDTVWGYFRDEMRVSPGLFYDKYISDWESIYSGVLPTDWRRAILNDAGNVAPSLVSDTEVPGDYRNVSEKTIMEFMGGSGGRHIPLDEIPNPYPPLSFPDFDMEIRRNSHTRQNLELQSIGGKPPLTYTLITNPTEAPLILNGDNIILNGPTAQQAGVFTGKIRVTDSLGATADAIITITVTANR